MCKIIERQSSTRGDVDGKPDNVFTCDNDTNRSLRQGGWGRAMPQTRGTFVGTQNRS